MVNTVHADYYEAESFWIGEALKDPGNRIRIEKTIDLIPQQTATLLDVGCGNGIFGHKLLEMRPEIAITGVDRSKAALSQVTFSSQLASIDALPFADQSFNLVSCLQVIEHLPNSVYTASLAELARVAETHIIIGVPYDEDLEKETTQCPQCRAVFNIDFHLRRYRLSDIEGLFSDAGFKCVNHVFPAAKTRTKYINEIVAAVKGQLKETYSFRSPVCPVCEYTEGDKTALNGQAASAPPSLVGAGPLPRRLAKGALRAVTSMLPTEEVSGYWVIALYERL